MIRNSVRVSRTQVPSTTIARPSLSRLSVAGISLSFPVTRGYAVVTVLSKSAQSETLMTQILVLSGCIAGLILFRWARSLALLALVAGVLWFYAITQGWMS